MARRFIAEFSGRDETHGLEYTGRWAWDLNNGRDHQTTSSVVNGQTQNQTWIDLYKAGAPTSYFWCQQKSVCDTDMLVPPMRPFALPADSEFVGTAPVGGVQAQHWRYTYAGDRLRLVTDYFVGTRDDATSGEALWFPLRTEYSGTQPRVVVDWTSVEVAALPPSDYEVPPSAGCGGASSPGDVLGAAKSMARGSMAKMDAATVPEQGMGAIARMMGAASLRAGLPRGGACSDPSQADVDAQE